MAAGAATDYHPCMNLLVVDDDDLVRQTLRRVLSQEGWKVVAVGSLERARAELARNDFIVAIVDLNLDGENGLTLVRELDDEHGIGVIILSGRADPADRVIGIEIGADDYLTKPFDNRELVARVRRRIAEKTVLRAAVQRTQAGIGELRVAGWRIDLVAHRAAAPDGSQVVLSDAETRVLTVLAGARGLPIGRDEIHRRAFGGERDPLDRRIGVHIAHVRKKLGLTNVAGIRTVHRVGYVLEIDPDT